MWHLRLQQPRTSIRKCLCARIFSTNSQRRFSVHMPADQWVTEKTHNAWPTPITFENLDCLERKSLRNKGATDEDRQHEDKYGCRMFSQTSGGISKVKRTLRPELQQEAPRDS